MKSAGKLFWRMFSHLGLAARSQSTHTQKPPWDSPRLITSESEGPFALGWGGYSHCNRELGGGLRGTPQKEEEGCRETQWAREAMATIPLWGLSQIWSCPGPGAGQAGRRPVSGLGLCVFVLKVPRRRDHWPFLAWALRASGNSSRTIISGGMCYSSIFSESQAGSHKIRIVCLWPP